MYCGSCLRDNALAAELKSRGHDVVLVPLYTPTLTDEPNVSEARVFFGGISVYLQQKARVLSLGAAHLRHAARRAVAHQSGFVRIDFHRSAIARRADDLDAQGRRRLSAERIREDARVAGRGAAARRGAAAERAALEPGATASSRAQGAGALHAAGRRSVSRRPHEGAPCRGARVDSKERRVGRSIHRRQRVLRRLHGRISRRFRARRSTSCRSGSTSSGFERRRDALAATRPFTVGYLARIAPEKGLLALCEAYVRFRQMPGVTSRASRRGGLSRARSAERI